VVIDHSRHKFNHQKQNKHCKRHTLNYSILQLLINSNCDVNHQSNLTNSECTFGKSAPLHVAAELGDLESIRILVAGGANLDLKNQKGDTPLAVAAFFVQTQVIQALIDAKCDINLPNLVEATPLHVVCTEMQPNSDSPGDYNQAAKILINAKADLNACAEKCRSPLHLASLSGKLDIASLLLESGCDKDPHDEEGETPLHIAILNQNDELSTYLVNSRCDVNAKNMNESSPLHVAAAMGSISVIELLIQSGADKQAKDQGGDIPLHCAALYGNVDAIEVLLNECIIENEEKSTSLEGDQPKIHPHCTAQNNDGDTPLHIAVNKGHDHIVKLLITISDLKITNNDGKTPMENISDESVTTSGLGSND